MSKSLIGRSLLTFDAIGLIVGGFIADMNATHIYNPRWSPHAKFHDAQTISFGVVLGLVTLFFTWRRSGDRQTNMLAAALFGVVLFWAQAGAYAFPGVAWKDPEFLKAGQSLSDFGPQILIGISMNICVFIATWLAWPRATDSAA